MQPQTRSNDLSFLPEDYVERRKEHRTNLICLTLFVVVLVGVVGAYFVTTRQRSEVRVLRQQVNAAYTEAGRRIEQLEKLQQQGQQIMNKAQVTVTLVEKVPRTFLLADMINRMPQSLSLLEAKLTSKAGKPPVIAVMDPKKSAMANAKKKAEPRPEDLLPPPQVVSLTLVGVAPTDVQVAQYIASLGRSPMFQDVNLVYSEETKIELTPMRKFRIEMTLSDKADARTLEPLVAGQKPSRNPLKTDLISAPPSASPAGKSGGQAGGGFWQSFGAMLGRAGSAPGGAASDHGASSKVTQTPVPQEP
jgi:Tfp pilus assembly protein PilN